MFEEKKLLIRKLQERLVPFLIAQGFEQLPLLERERKSREMVLAFPLGRFRRAGGRNFDLVNIQLHPRRAAFVLNFAVALPEGVTYPWGHFSQSEMDASYPLERCRLYSNRRFMRWIGPPWLSFAKTQEIKVGKAVDRTIALYPEMESYFSERTLGPHVKCLSRSFDPSGKERIEVRRA